MDRCVVQAFPTIFFFLMSIVHVNSCLAAPAGDQEIYQVVLERMLKHEAPSRFAVWNAAIPSTTILLPRVPRHTPENQFVSNLRGLPLILQARLLEGQGVSPTPLVRFDVGANSAAFLGFVDQTQFRKIAKEDGRPGGLLEVGFSKIVYDQNAGNALVYVESCLTLAESVCGGEGYWLVWTRQNWKVKKHAYLWQGATVPFWKITVDAS